VCRQTHELMALTAARGWVVDQSHALMGRWAASGVFTISRWNQFKGIATFVFLHPTPTAIGVVALEAAKSTAAEFNHLLISLTTIESLGRNCTFAFPNLSPTVIRSKLRFCGQTYVYSAPAVNKSATGKKRVCRCSHELHSNSIVAATIHHPLRGKLCQSGKHERH